MFRQPVFRSFLQTAGRNTVFEGRGVCGGHIDQPEGLTVLHDIDGPLTFQVDIREHLLDVGQDGVFVFVVAAHQRFFMHLVDDVVVALMGAGGIVALAEAGLHDVRIPVRIDAQDLVGIEVNEYAVFGVKRQALVDAGVVLFVFDELADHPLVGGADAVYAGRRRRMSHAGSLVLDEQQVFAQLTDFFLAGDFRVAEVELTGVSAGFDEVRFVDVQIEGLHGPGVNDGQGSLVQRAVVQPGQLQDRHGNLGNPGLRNPEEAVLFSCGADRRQPVAHGVLVHAEHLVDDRIQVQDVQTLAEHVIGAAGLGRILLGHSLCVERKNFFVGHGVDVDLHQMAGRLRTDFFGKQTKVSIGQKRGTFRQSRIGDSFDLAVGDCQDVRAGGQFVDRPADDLLQQVSIDLFRQLGLVFVQLGGLTRVHVEEIVRHGFVGQSGLAVGLFEGVQLVRVEFEHLSNLIFQAAVTLLIKKRCEHGLFSFLSVKRSYRTRLFRFAETPVAGVRLRLYVRKNSLKY